MVNKTRVVDHATLQHLFQQPHWIELEKALTVINRQGCHDWSMTVAFVEVVLLHNTLAYCDFNQVRAAKLLNMSRTCLRQKLSKYSIWQVNTPI